MQTSAYLVETLATHLIAFLAGVLLTVLVLRSYWSRSKSMRALRLRVRELQKAVNAFSHHYHHGGISSRGKSARGLINLVSLATKTIIIYCQKYVEPVHPSASELIIKECRNILSYCNKAEDQIKQIEEDNIRPIKNFEHLQK